jgi:DNA polymerase-3 subunit epsilon
MLICALDIETTGLNTPEHRIIEVYAGLWELRTQKLIRAVEVRINPERSIGVEAQRVHGIAITDLAGCPTWDKAAVNIHSHLRQADVLIAHNGDDFDIPFLNREFERVGFPAIDKPLIDTMIEGKWATFQGEVPSLQKLCFACDVPYDKTKAHAASYDVEVMIECFFRGLEWGRFKLPETASEDLADAA